jgi:hypothetical protein
LTLELSKNIRCFSNMRSLPWRPSSALSSDSAISRALARVKRVLNDYTLASELDRQFGDLPVGLRKILLSMIHGFARTPAVSAAQLKISDFLIFAAMYYS